MSEVVVSISDGIELIIDESENLSTAERSMVLTSALIEQIGEGRTVIPSLFQGSLVLDVGYRVYRVYYQLRIKRVMDALSIYSDAISHIESNPHLYDQRLAKKAIETLRECFYRKLD